MRPAPMYQVMDHFEIMEFRLASPLPSCSTHPSNYVLF